MINTGLLNTDEINATVRVALDEDIGSGDLTANLLSDRQASAELICREDAILSGRPWVDRSFSLLDASVLLDWQQDEGEQVHSGQVICQIRGPARSILTAERTAINFLQTLSGVATTTRRYVDAVAGTGCRILDTRKTLPGLRKAEKYAVSCGGGLNHRIGLYDAVLIKENHIHSAGSVCQALELAHRTVGPGVLIEIEVEDLAQLGQAIECGAKRVLLDNFPVNLLAEAVKLADGRAETEVSGNVTLENVHDVASSGINYVSIGALTKNVRAIDFSLLFTI
ncbi:MAG: carboxylating nicotinate-nucleotide diphosphorylase [Gammaproteobacteria bacterium]|nr:carboxylating nicotinate-nucleotide diphosphorylase [Gammaproteobacteria bacterium]MDX2488523.1 carboxylating nicotinate-nucleotide diphosphorylase [Gammaproteobacteria bacterium]